MASKKAKVEAETAEIESTGQVIETNEVQQLAEFLVSNFPGEPKDPSETPIQVAIRLLGERAKKDLSAMSSFERRRFAKYGN